MQVQKHFKKGHQETTHTRVHLFDIIYQEEAQASL